MRFLGFTLLVIISQLNVGLSYSIERNTKAGNAIYPLLILALTIITQLSQLKLYHR
jgi:hypothetical protein